MKIFPKRVKGFDKPTLLPSNDREANEWQKANVAWWSEHPMRYDWNIQIPAEEYTEDFFREIDKRFFQTVFQYMPYKKLPFENLIDFNALQSLDVLEIGIGTGSVAQLLAEHTHSFTGIDITDYAVNCTIERMRLFGLKNTNIAKMDAEDMHFGNESFDFVWSWGVIHHSSNTRRILEEIRRILRPRGRAVIMVNHRSLLVYYLIPGISLGIIKGGFLQRHSIHKLVQSMTDGALARYYSIPEWKKICLDLFGIENAEIFGEKASMIPLPGGPAKNLMISLIPNWATRLVSNSWKMGEFLVSTLIKNDR